jgi:flagellar motor switch protein FliM
MLSQAEIDALLAGAIEVQASGEEGQINLAAVMGGAKNEEPAKEAGASKKIQAYNFWSPERISKEQLRALELIHEDLAERLTTSLPALLRTPVRPRLVHTETGRFYDFIRDAPENSLYHLIRLAPLPGETVLTMSPDLAFKVLDLQLGANLSAETRPGELTMIDQELLHQFVERILNDVKASWSKVVSLEPTLEDETSNQNWVLMVMGNERVIVLSFEVAVQNVTGVMNLYIPFASIKPISQDLNPYVWIGGRKEKVADPKARQVIEQRIYDVQLPARVLLGKTKLSIGQITHLEPGDVLVLDTRIRDNLVLSIGEHTRFEVRVGRSGNHLAAQVVSVMHDIPNAKE